MELPVARPVTAAAVEVQVAEELDERLEVLQALDVGYLTAFAHGNPSPTKAVDSAVEPTSRDLVRKFRAEQAWGHSTFPAFLAGPGVGGTTPILVFRRSARPSLSFRTACLCEGCGE